MRIFKSKILIAEVAKAFLLASSLLIFHLQTPAQKHFSGVNQRSGLFLGAYAGPSLLTEVAPDSLIPEIQNYFNKLRSGWHYGFETEYYFNKYIGGGAKYQHFNTKQDVDSIVVEFFSQKFYIDLSSNMSINTVSLQLFGRVPLQNGRLAIGASAGPAWFFYRNLGKAVGDSAMFKGSSPGISSSVWIGYEVIPNLQLTAQSNYVRAILKEFTRDDGSTSEVISLKESEYQNISRFDFSFGIIYSFSQNNKKRND